MGNLSSGKTSDKGILNDFSLVWFDPKVALSYNKKFREQLTSMFSEARFVSNPLTLGETIDDSSKPVVFLSCGSGYAGVRDFVEAKNYVVGVFIFCMRIEDYLHFMKDSKKVIGVVDVFSSLQEKLQDVHEKYIHFSRFYESRDEKTFYTVKDKDTIIESLSVAVRTNKFSIFYPIGMPSISIAQTLTADVLTRIGIRAMGDIELRGAFARKVKDVLSFLSDHHEMKDVVRSYTMEKLYYMLNLYLRYGKPEGFALFKEYMLCLKGSICEVGRPMIQKGIKLYRGLHLLPKFLKEYGENIGKIVLLNSFTSTSLEEEFAFRFANMSKKGAPAIFEIRLVDFDKSFADFIAGFGFPEENGVFFPADISEYSVYPVEREVLFPPFYPIRIVAIQKVKNKRNVYDKIVAEAPYCVNITGKNFWGRFHKGESHDMNWSKDYLESMLKLVAKGVLNKLSIVKLRILKRDPTVAAQLEAVLEGNTHIQEIVIDHEGLGEIRYFSLLEKLARLAPSLRYLSLMDNNLGDPAGEVLGSMLLSREDCVLQELWLCGNNISAKGSCALGIGARACKTLRVLNLQRNLVPGSAAGEICTSVSRLERLSLAGNRVDNLRGIGLGENEWLRGLELQENTISASGGAELGRGLSRNRRLEELNVSLNPLGDDGAKGVAAGLGKASVLTKLEMSVCQISDEGAISLAAVLYDNSSLKTLNLKGNRIGERGGVALGTMLSHNCALIELNLSGNLVGDRGAANIGLGLTYNKSLQELNLTSNMIKAEGGRGLGKGVGENNALRTLDLSLNRIEDSAAEALGLGLRRNSVLAVLNLSQNMIKAKGGASIGVGLVQNVRLSSLNLTNNLIGDSGAEAIGTGLESNSALLELFLAGNGITGTGGRALGSALRQNMHLGVLDLRWNDIGEDGGAAVGEGLAKNHSITTLLLRTKSLGPAGGKAIAMALRDNVDSKVSVLRLEESPVTSVTGEVIGESLGVRNVLCSVMLWKCKIGDPGAKAIWAGLAKNKSLLELDLTENGIGPEGVRNLPPALANNSTLKSLNLACNILGVEGAQLVAEGIRENWTLKRLVARENGIGNAGGLALAVALRENQAVTELDVSENAIDDRGGVEIGKALDVNTTLLKLRLTGNTMGNVGRSIIGAIAEF